MPPFVEFVYPLKLPLSLVNRALVVVAVAESTYVDACGAAPYPWSNKCELTFAPYSLLNCCRLCFEALIALVAIPYALLPLAFWTIYVELFDLPPYAVVAKFFFTTDEYDMFADQFSTFSLLIFFSRLFSVLVPLMICLGILFRCCSLALFTPFAKHSLKLYYYY